MKERARHSVVVSEPIIEPISRAEFRAEIDRLASEIGAPAPSGVRVTDLRTKWASCSTRGRLTFDAGLLAQPAGIRIEVIVHELLHLTIPDHGPLFRARLKAHLAAIARRSGDRQVTLD